MADSTVTQTVGFDPTVKPYAERMLANAEQASQRPYEQYAGGDVGARVAQFNPLQQQAFTAAGGMQPSEITGQAASGLQGIAERAGNLQYNPYQTGQFAGQAEQYMSPYMQNVVDIQQREAQRQADIAGTQRGAQAAGAGAFGGSRQAIMDAEAARNLAIQKGDIQAQGLQQAYDKAQQQFNTEQALREQSGQFGANLGLQGLQTAGQAQVGAGNLGQQQFQQGMDITGLQSTLGGTQQQQAQNVLNTQYQQWLDQQNYPLQQAGYMSNIINRLPQSNVLNKTTTEAQPSFLNQAAGLLTAGVGAAKQFGWLAAGGEVKGYAKGGVVYGLPAAVIQRIK